MHLSSFNCIKYVNLTKNIEFTSPRQHVFDVSFDSSTYSTASAKIRPIGYVWTLSTPIWYFSRSVSKEIKQLHSIVNVEIVKKYF